MYKKLYTQEVEKQIQEVFNYDHDYVFQNVFHFWTFVGNTRWTATMRNIQMLKYKFSSPYNEE